MNTEKSIWSFEQISIHSCKIACFKGWRLYLTYRIGNSISGVSFPKRLLIKFRFPMKVFYLLLFI